MLPYANPASRVIAVELGDRPCTGVGGLDFHFGRIKSSDPSITVPPWDLIGLIIPSIAGVGEPGRDAEALCSFSYKLISSNF